MHRLTIRSAEREKLAKLQSEHHALETAHRANQTKLSKAKQAVVRHTRAMKELNLSIERQEVAIQDLKNALEEDTPQEQELERLEGELREAQGTLELYENQFEDSVVQKDKLNAEQRPIKDKLNELQADIENAEKQVATATKALHKAEDVREARLRETNLRHEQVGDAERQKARLERECEGQVEKVHTFTTEAESVCLRVPIDEGATPEYIDKILDKLRDDKARYEEE